MIFGCFTCSPSCTNAPNSPPSAGAKCPKAAGKSCWWICNSEITCEEITTTREQAEGVEGGKALRLQKFCIPGEVKGPARWGVQQWQCQHRNVWQHKLHFTQIWAFSAVHSQDFAFLLLSAKEFFTLTHPGTALSWGMENCTVPLRISAIPSENLTWAHPLPLEASNNPCWEAKQSWIFTCATFGWNPERGESLSEKMKGQFSHLRKIWGEFSFSHCLFLTACVWLIQNYPRCSGCFIQAVLIQPFCSKPWDLKWCLNRAPDSHWDERPSQRKTRLNLNNSTIPDQTLWRWQDQSWFSPFSPRLSIFAAGNPQLGQEGTFHLQIHSFFLTFNLTDRLLFSS